jgi:hypothetical protein
MKNKKSLNASTSSAILAMYKDKTEIAGRLESQQRILSYFPVHLFKMFILQWRELGVHTFG